MTRKALLAWAAAMSLTASAFAQESATLTLRSGERVSAQLMDLGGVGYTVKVDGQQRQIPTNDVAAIDFTGGGVSNTDWDKLSGGGQVLIMKSGETVTGQLVDIGGSSPLRMTFKTPSGDRDIPSSDIARIIMALSSGLFAATAQGTAVALVDDHHRARAIAVVVGGTTVAVAVGAPLGALCSAVENATT